jgi:arylsulfatase A-like enzyme
MGVSRKGKGAGMSKQVSGGWRWRWAAALLGIGAVAQAAQAAEQPNIIFFLVDDMGWMDCGFNGSQYYETPNMDRLAKQGMCFTQAYAQPLCSPTRASILTGQYSARHRITSATGHQPPQASDDALMPKEARPNVPLLMPDSKNFLEPSQLTLAEVLRDAGYHTAHIGKWHLGLTQPHWPERQGFEVAFHAEPSPGPASYFSPYGVVPDGAPGGKQHVGTVTDGPAGEYITDRLTDEAVAFIARNKDRPFFLNLWQYGVHGPWGHKEAYTAAFAKKTDPRGAQGNPIMASMLKSVDESLGRVLATLDELKLAERTIIVFYSDNGGNVHSNTPDDEKGKRRKADDTRLLDWRKWAGDRPPTCNAPLRDGKGRLYEGGIRVPLVVRWPGRVAAGATSDAVVGCIDMYPTLLELAGLSVPAAQKVDGVSFAGVLRGTGALARDAYFTWFPHLVPGVAVRRGDWKLIRRFEPRPQDYEGLFELFNLKDDLSETKNLAAQMPEKVKELDALIDAFVKDTGALYPQPNPAYKPQAVAAAAAAAPKADPAQGLVAKFCRMTVAGGALRVEAEGKSPFLGTAQVKGTGPLTLQLRARAAAGGPGKAQWTTGEQTDFNAPGQTAEFALKPGAAWQDLSVALPIQGEPRIVRLYLPADKGLVEVQSIRYLNAAGKPVRAWSFGGQP